MVSKNNVKCAVALSLTLAMLFIVSIAASAAAPSTPTVSPAGGYESTPPVTVTISSDPGTKIYVTDNGTIPNSTLTPYSPDDTIQFSLQTGGTTLKAIAVANDNWAEASDMLVAFYSSNPPPTSITLVPNTLSLTSGGVYTLAATVSPMADALYAWSSDNPAVAAVDQNGRVTAGVPGTATITVGAYSTTLSATCDVTVHPASSGADSAEDGVQPSPAYEQAKIGNCEAWVYVRSGPGTGYDIVGQAFLGETVELLRWDDAETWCKVFFSEGNSTGWVHGKFIIPQS